MTPVETAMMMRNHYNWANNLMNQTLNTLIDDLHNPDKNVRSQAAVSLGKMGDTNLLPALLDALISEPDLYVREDITWALVRMKDAALQPLINLLDDANPHTRHEATHVLTKIGGQAVIDPLLHALHDTDPKVTSKAAFGLGQIGDERALPALISLVEHGNRDLQTMLMEVLERFGKAPAQPLIELMSDSRWQVREQAADILGALKAKDALPALIAALKDEAWQVRFSALTALNHIGGPQAKTAIQALPNDTDEHVQALVARLKRRFRW